MRRRFRQRKDGTLVEIDLNAPRPKPKGPLIVGDLPEYESPIDGRIISGRKQRREDLARSGCRPAEDLEVEKREAERFRAEEQAKQDQFWEEAVEKTWYDLRDGRTPRPEIPDEMNE